MKITTGFISNSSSSSFIISTRSDINHESFTEEQDVYITKIENIKQLDAYLKTEFGLTPDLINVDKFFSWYPKAIKELEAGLTVYEINADNNHYSDINHALKTEFNAKKLGEY